MIVIIWAKNFFLVSLLMLVIHMISEIHAKYTLQPLPGFLDLVKVVGPPIYFFAKSVYDHKTYKKGSH